jgi:16S rRNA processing protein RimM
LKGELKVQTFSRNPGDLKRYIHLYLLEADGSVVKFQLEWVRVHNRIAVVKLAGLNDRTQAEELKDQLLWVRKDQVPEPVQGEYFISDLLGMQVFSDSGEVIGKLMDVLELPAHDVYQIQNDKREYLIPAVKQFIVDVNLEQHIMIVRIPEGL